MAYNLCVQYLDEDRVFESMLRRVMPDSSPQKDLTLFLHRNSRFVVVSAYFYHDDHPDEKWLLHVPDQLLLFQ